MNNLPDDIGKHPTEEQLMELAINGGAQEHRTHLETCEACARTVREFNEVSRQVVSLGEEEVPRRLEQRIMTISRHGSGGGLISALQALVANPFLIALAVAVVVILLYFLVGMEVFKEP
jgi:anti-sigma factor RsiW